MSAQARHDPRYRYHLWALLTAPIIFVVLSLTTSLNPIYASVIAMTLGGFAAWYCRPDLKKKMIVSISGILVAGVPLEELLFAFSFGFLWSGIYEHSTWRKAKQ